MRKFDKFEVMICEAKTSSSLALAQNEYELAVPIHNAGGCVQLHTAAYNKCSGLEHPTRCQKSINTNRPKNTVGSGGVVRASFLDLPGEPLS
jgi:hypothetical protein